MATPISGSLPDAPQGWAAGGVRMGSRGRHPVEPAEGPCAGCRDPTPLLTGVCRVDGGVRAQGGTVLFNQPQLRHPRHFW